MRPCMQRFSRALGPSPSQGIFLILWVFAVGLGGGCGSPAPRTQETGCVVPFDDMKVYADTVLCGGEYSLGDRGEKGVVHLMDDNITLSCQADTVLKGHGKGIAVRADTGRPMENITIRDCRFREYETFILAIDVSGLRILNNRMEEGGNGVEISNVRSRVKDVLVEGNVIRVQRNGIMYAAEQDAENVRVFRNEITAREDGFNIWDHYTQSTYAITENTFHGSEDGETVGIYCNLGSVIMEGNRVAGPTKTGRNILAQDALNLTFRGNDLGGASFVLEGARRCVFEENFIGGGIEIGPSPETGIFSRDLVFTNNVMRSGLHSPVRVRSARYVEFVSNTFTGGDPLVHIAADARFVKVRENILVSSGSTLDIRSGPLSELDIDRNVIHDRNHGFRSRWNGKTYRSLDRWRKKTRFDIHSVNQVPEIALPGQDRVM